MKLSICFGTMNRKPYLEKCITSARESIGELDHEFVIAVGPSSDGTLEYLQGLTDSDIKLIVQEERLGAVRAFNACFFAARGEYVFNYNDDAEVVGDTLAKACFYLDEHQEAGQVAIPFSLPNEPPHVDYVNLWKRRIIYANFGVTRRGLGNKLGWWGATCYQYSGDTELSIKVWLENKYVAPLEGGHIIHHQANDDTRVPNVESHRIGRLYNNSVPPPIIRKLGTPKAETNYSKPVIRPPKIQTPARIIIRRHRPSGIEGMTLIKYLGNGWQPVGAPSGTAYRFSGGAEFYVDDKDLEFILQNVPAGDKVGIV